MRKRFILQIVCFISFSLFSQNLINNGNFEEYSNCPDASGQIEYSIGWNNPTSLGTPDFFHGCSSGFGVPSYCNCEDVFQYAKFGIGYSGIWCYADGVINGREYLQTELSDSLVNNNCYFVSMYVNSINWAAYGVNKLGLYFSNNLISATDTNYFLNFQPQIFSNEIIFDTLNWIQVYGIFKAQDNEKYLTIGQFFDDSAIDKQLFNGDIVGVSLGAYYLIDDISLFQLGGNYAGKDSTIFLGESIFIGQNVENLPSKWSILGGAEIATNVSGVLVSPTETTTYICEQNFCNEIMYDTVTVFINGVGLAETLKPQKIIIYPNPNDGTFSIELNTPIAIQELHILDALGRKVIVLDEKQTNFEVKLQKGVYFLEFISEKRRVLEKVVVN